MHRITPVRAHRTMGMALVLGLAAQVFAFSADFTPPGTEKARVAGKTLYVDRNEVRNADWAEYLYDLKNTAGEGSAAFRQALPDSTAWNSVYGSGMPRVNGAFADHPVVGISYGQVEAYCRWRSERVRAKYGKDVTYRLPTIAEWEQILGQARNGPAEKGLNKASQGTGIDHLVDNVSEMVAEPGVAKGGNWSLSETGPASAGPVTQTYHGPANWLGFRCVAEVK